MLSLVAADAAALALAGAADALAGAADALAGLGAVLGDCGAVDGEALDAAPPQALRVRTSAASAGMHEGKERRFTLLL